ncbi:MAG: YggS family pyridoxal phosphate-dependent enzyme [Cystobacterineae bacterium]|nr:YggS family pyridoxal phosphate-dependent enzyme [Cystobacterineae bacterium]
MSCDQSMLCERIAQVQTSIHQACLRSGRAPHSVQLLAVSKYQPTTHIQQAWELGLLHFGENYAQELRDKAAQLHGLHALKWHAIGPVQKKNAKYIAQSAWAFHALDDLGLAEKLSQQRQGEPLRCFIQLNVADEPQKSGIQPAKLASFLEALSTLRGLSICGLSCLPPFSKEPEKSRPYFKALAALAHAHQLKELSMGTTQDFHIAIEEGATWVRVGTALFGGRPNNAGRGAQGT